MMIAAVGVTAVVRVVKRVIWVRGVVFGAVLPAARVAAVFLPVCTVACWCIAPFLQTFHHVGQSWRNAWIRGAARCAIRVVALFLNLPSHVSPLLFSLSHQVIQVIARILCRRLCRVRARRDGVRPLGPTTAATLPQHSAIAHCIEGMRHRPRVDTLG